MNTFIPREATFRDLLDCHRDRFPRDEHISISVEQRTHGNEDELRVRLWRMRGMGRDAFYLEHEIDISIRHLAMLRGNVPATLDLLRDAVRYLVVIVFPAPLPKFRLRHDAKWGRA